MQCWLKQQQGTLNYAFDSKQSIAFELFDSNTSKIIGTAEVKLQWVYQTDKKSVAGDYFSHCIKDNLWIITALFY